MSDRAFDLALKIAGLLGWILSGAMFIWLMSRRTQGWDRGNTSWLQLNGDKDSKSEAERRGLLERYEADRRADEQWKKELQESVMEATGRVRGLQDGLGAHGSRSDIIAQNARKSLLDAAREAAEARANRAALVAHQHQQFELERDPMTYPELPPRPDPRREPEDRRGFNPDDTGRFRPKKR